MSCEEYDASRAGGAAYFVSHYVLTGAAVDRDALQSSFVVHCRQPLSHPGRRFSIVGAGRVAGWE